MAAGRPTETAAGKDQARAQAAAGNGGKKSDVLQAVLLRKPRQDTQVKDGGAEPATGESKSDLHLFASFHRPACWNQGADVCAASAISDR